MRLVRNAAAAKEHRVEAASVKTLPIFVESGKRILQIADLNSAVDNLVLSRIIGGSISLGYRIIGAPGTFTVVESSTSLSSMIAGFFAELLSDEKISTITYRKASPFATGRAVARYEILKNLTSQENQSYITGIPKEIAGDGTRQGRPYLGAACQTLAVAEAPALQRALQTIVANEILLDRERVMQKFVKDFMPTSDTLVARSKHVSRTEVKKGKKKAVISRTLDPARPDSLSTVAPVEKQYVHALFCRPWAALAEMRTEYDRTPLFEKRPGSFVMEARRIIDQMWHNKRYVMRSLRHREIRQIDGHPLTLSNSLEKTSESLKEFTTLFALREVWQRERSLGWITSFRGSEFKFEEGGSFADFIDTNPSLSLLREIYDSYNTWAHEEYLRLESEKESQKPEKAPENLFAVLAESDHKSASVVES
jgi:hypothetical protein